MRQASAKLHRTAPHDKKTRTVVNLAYLLCIFIGVTLLLSLKQTSAVVKNEYPSIHTILPFTSKIMLLVTAWQTEILLQGNAIVHEGSTVHYILWVAMTIVKCTITVNVLLAEQQTSTMAIDVNRCAMQDWFTRWSLEETRPTVYCWWRWLLIDAIACLLLSAISFGIQLFWSIVQVMSIEVAGPTSIVQGNTHL